MSERSEATGTTRGLDDAALDAPVQAALVAHLYRNSPIAIVAGAAAAVTLAAVLRASVPAALIVTWLGCLLGLSAGRIAHIRALGHQAPSSPEETRRRYRLHAWPAALSAAIWGAGLWLFGPHAPVEHVLLYVLVAAGMAAGAISVLGSMPGVFVAYVALSLGPAALWFALAPEPGAVVAVFAALYAGILCIVGLRQGKTLASAYRLAHENEDLVGELRDAAQAVRESNEALAAREAQLRGIVDLVPFPLYAKSRDGRFVLANEATAEAHGTTVEALLASPPDAFGLEHGEVEERLAVDRAVIDSGVARHNFEQTFTEPSGRVRISRTSKIRILDTATGEPLVLGVSVDITDLKQAEHETLRHKALLEAILENLPVCIYRRVRHPDGTLTYPFISASEFGTFRYDAERYLSGRDAFVDTIHPEDRPAWATAVEASATSLETFEHEFRIVDDHGNVRWVRGLARPRAGADGTVIWDGIELDITERKRVEAALVESEERFRSAFDSAPVGMALVQPDRTVLKVNQTLCRMLGYGEEDLLGRSIDEVTHPDDIALSEERHAQIFAGGEAGYALEKRYLHREGRVIWAYLNVTPVRDDDGAPRYAIAQVQDITESRRLSEELSYQATHDALTGLVNRNELEKRLARVIEAAARDETAHALCYLDLDQFKVINDTCGHIAGDELLRQVARLVSANVRSTDTVARLGGDEFALLMERCDVQQASRVADAVREEVASHRFQWDGKCFSVGTSIGVVPIDAGSASVTEVLRAADAACYTAKDHGRNRVQLYHVDDAALARRRGEMQWVERLGRAIDEDRLRLMAQPIEPLGHAAGPQVEHVEVLLRLAAEDGALVPPGAFLPAAERYNMAERIDRWVVEAVLGIVADAAACGQAPKLVAVNLSGQSVGSEEFRGFLRERLGARGELARRICFEITETAAITNLASAASFMEDLKSIGCSFALDDFGSGLSSFGYLKNLPIDYLKIDGAFVKDILDDPMSLAIVRSINEIGHVLGKRTIAEFVETSAIRDRLAELGVDYAQGYGVGRPVPIGEIVGVGGDDVRSAVGL